MFGFGKKAKGGRATSRTRTKRKLSRAQLAQRKYAAAMRGVRARAASTRGGRGRIAKRKSARRLRQRLGVRSS